jgi:two-component system, LytTR family, sensor kinase
MPVTGATVRKVLFVCILLCTILAVPLGYGIYSQSSALGGRPSLALIFVQPLLITGFLAILGVPLYALIRKYPGGPGRWIPAIVLHLIAFPSFTVVYYSLRYVGLIAINVRIREGFFEFVQSRILAQPANNTWQYVTVAVACYALRYYWLLEEREKQQSELRIQLARYELQMLKLQLHPHFLFNTLNGISALMMRDVPVAQHMLVCLADLFRMALEHSSKKFILLRDELKFVQSYLELQGMRFDGRLKVDIDIEPETLNLLVPNMILQPVVENAVRHGIEPRRDRGTIVIRSNTVGGNLRIEVENDGPLIEETIDTRGTGVGIRNLRSRLTQLYGESQTFEVGNRNPNGVRVTLEIPASRVIA